MTEKEGQRGSDEAFYKLILVAGDAVLKLAGVAAGFPYELRAETLKEKKVSPDIVGVPLRQDGAILLSKALCRAAPSGYLLYGRSIFQGSPAPEVGR